VPWWPPRWNRASGLLRLGMLKRLGGPSWEAALLTQVSWVAGKTPKGEAGPQRRSLSVRRSSHIDDLQLTQAIHGVQR
jgi:hypothetical protein